VFYDKNYPGYFTFHGTFVLGFSCICIRTIDEVGGFVEVGAGNSKVLKAAQFAVLKQAERTNSNIKLISIVSAKQQLVAGMNYQLVLIVSINGENQKVSTVVYSKLDGTYQLRSWN
jgi:hypothetical protein